MLAKTSLYVLAYFGPQTAARLEVVHDPDEPVVQLVAWVQTDLPPDEGVKRLDRLDWEWWLEQARAVKGKLLVSLEHV
ncbi:MAG: hypothetical protein EXR47_00405 [Dehalococcoidia bacterium]|nr:hypothetical protein [Dehalococcoidia bacterium]